MKKILLLIITFSFAFTNFAQDTCATAVTITAGTYTVTVIDGTEAPDPICAENGAGTDPLLAEWYSYTPSFSGAVTINTNIAANLGRDTRFHVYTGACGSLTCHASGEDIDSSNYLSTSTFPVESGVTYIIAFDSRWETDGFDFVLSEDPSTTCNSTFPLNEDWTSVFGLGCWSVEDLANDALTWSHNGVNDFNGDGTNDPIVNIFPAADSNGPMKNDWLISNTFSFDASHTYDITVRSNSIHLDSHTGMTADESFDIIMLDGPSSNANNQILLESVSNIVPLGAFGDTTGNDPISMAYTNTNTFTPPTSGDYNLGIHAITPQGGDILFISNISIIDNGVAAINENILASSVSIYPNVTSDNFTVKNTSNITLTSVSLFDINGRVVLTSNLNNSVVNVSNLSAGMYFVEINSADAKITRKLIKK